MLDQLRDSILTAVVAPFASAYPGITLVGDNTPFDYNNPPEKYVSVEIEFHDGQTIGMRAQPKTRVFGYVYVEANVQLGLGSKWALQTLGWFTETLEYRTFGRAQVQEAIPEGHEKIKGRYIESLKLAFYADPA